MKHTFWDLLTAHKIIIPSIQRDYAQGRENPAVNAIRIKFVADLLDSITFNKYLYLDFVYGKVKGLYDGEFRNRNKRNLENLLETVKSYAKDVSVGFIYEMYEDEEHEWDKDFIPLDGQQRLTTLFALHWYLILRLALSEERQKLTGFSYQTRTSSTDFLAELCILELKDIRLQVEKLSEELSSQKNFFSSWLKDPTVKGLLVTLDLIHISLRLASNAELEQYWFNLTAKKCIEFDFLDLEKLELTDELYVRMNARGKQLTDFENFKAWLFKQIGGLDIDIPIQNWKVKFEVAWSDVFWSCKAPNLFELDDVYLQYFKLNFMADYVRGLRVADNKFAGALNDDDPAYHHEVQAFITTLQTTQGYFDPFASFNKPLFWSKLPAYLITLDYISTNLNLLNELMFTGDGINFWNKYVSESPNSLLFGPKSQKLTLSELALHYGLLRYIFLFNLPLLEYRLDQKKEFQKYCRVLMNLIFNQRIESGPVYKLVVDGIEEILQLYIAMEQPIILLLLSKGITSISGFTDVQVKEEILKSKLILEDQLWEYELVTAENNLYFFGQVGFIIELADYNLDRFRLLSRNLDAVFSHPVLSHSEHILQRALLTKGDYLIKKGQNWSFCLNNYGTVRDRNENWRTIFSGTEPEKRDFLSALTSDVLFDADRVVTSMINIIERDGQNVSGMLKKFVEMPKLIGYCGNRQIRLYEDHPDSNVYLLKTNSLRGYFPEVHSIAIYEFFKDRFFRQYCIQFDNPKPDWNEFVRYFKPMMWYNYASSGKEIPSLGINFTEPYTIWRDADQRIYFIKADHTDNIMESNEQGVYDFIEQEIIQTALL